LWISLFERDHVYWLFWGLHVRNCGWNLHPLGSPQKLTAVEPKNHPIENESLGNLHDLRL